MTRDRSARGPIVELSVHPDVAADHDAVLARAAKRAGVRTDSVFALRVRRRSIDARKGRVRIALVVELDLLSAKEPEPVAPVELPALVGEPEVLVVGAGPAGMFCAWQLAQAGVSCLVLERGRRVRARRRDLAALTRRGVLDPDSNYCFGEGGAGTFSDGKLYTRSHKRGEVHRVLDALIGYGASPDIAVDARPHIGTNRLPGVITKMREHLESAGVRFVFESRVDELVTDHGMVAGVRLSDGTTIDARAVVVAPGHSARDVQQWVARAGAEVEFKPFALGVRIEHPQAFVDRIQFGSLAGHPLLGAASYRLVHQACGSGVFSFCMCPGGFMAPAATEAGGQVVNGWSPSSRRGRWANSGFVAEVGPELLAQTGLDPLDPFSGVEFQRRFERAAYDAGGGDYVGPAQRLDDFIERRVSRTLPDCSYPRGVQSARLDELLGPLHAPLSVALRSTDRAMPGFIGDHALAVGVESRTSSPVRTKRDPETLEALGVRGLWVCGEGAGFAGGIMSAALDGIRVAEAIARTRLAP